MSKKVILLGDCHIGARNASPVVCEFQIKFFEEQLFPYMKKHGITTILQHGDLFDSRKFSNHVILYQWKTRVFNYMESNGIEFITFLGNHDIAYRNSLHINSTSLFLHSYNSVKIIDGPCEYSFDGVPFLFVPWICESNKDEVEKIVKETTALFCAGHFEFAGFEMYKGGELSHGMETKSYDCFDEVFSGHFHSRNKKGNIHYIGTPYEMSWSDYGDTKGFHVFDTKTRTTSFIKNTESLFFKMEYDDKGKEPQAYSGLADRYVKLIVLNKTDPYKFEKFINNIIMQNPADLKITEAMSDFDDIEIKEAVKVEDTKTMINSFVDQVETDLDKETLSTLMNKLYLEAQDTIA